MELSEAFKIGNQRRHLEGIRKGASLVDTGCEPWEVGFVQYAGTSTVSLVLSATPFGLQLE